MVMSWWNGREQNCEEPHSATQSPSLEKEPRKILKFEWKRVQLWKKPV